MSSPTTNLISTVPSLRAFLSSITPASTLYIDLEGRSLGRHGTLTLMTILLNPESTVHIIDIQTLGPAAFTTSTALKTTLVSILADASIAKYLWDVRADADALWVHHQVTLANVTDVQLLENASRQGDKTHVRGLDVCVQNDLKLGFMMTNRWLRTKELGRGLMARDTFSKRPLEENAREYCVNDVVHLPALRHLYEGRLDIAWMQKVADESAARVQAAQSVEGIAQGYTRARGPWGSGVGSKTAVREDDWLERLENHMDWEDDDDDYDYDYEYNDWLNEVTAADEVWDGYISG